MTTCFLFSEYLHEEGCLSLTLKDDGAMDAPAQQRSFEDIKKLQENASTVVVAGTEQASILEVELPWLAEKKARAAIPFALEDELAQSVNSLHFAFDRQHYRNNRYLVVVFDKQDLQQLIEKLRTESIGFDLITVDWFALHENEMCLTEDKLLIHQKEYKGALSLELADIYLKKAEQANAYYFNDSKPPLSLANFDKIDAQSFHWLAKRLQDTKPINLCQGEFQQAEQGTQFIKKGYQLLAILAGVWLLMVILTDLITVHFLNQEISEVDNKIEVIYKEFFPQAKQVISPKFRISQLLGDGDKTAGLQLWQLLNSVSKSMQDNSIRLEQLTYQNNRLSITLASDDFASLERFENRLKQQQLKVNRTQAATQDNKVLATLELT